MKRLYGDRLRKDGGLTKTVKNIAGRTLAQRAGKRATDIRRVMMEVTGSIEKVEEKVTEAVEEFLDSGWSLWNVLTFADESQPVQSSPTWSTTQRFCCSSHASE